MNVGFAVGWILLAQNDQMMQNFTLLSVTNASVLRVDHKSGDGEHPGYPSTTISAFRLSHN